MAQKLINLIFQPVPVQSTGTTQFTASSFDMNSLPGGLGNVTDCTIFVKATVLRHEIGGGTYSNTWERVMVFRRAGVADPAIVGSQANGNTSTGGNLGQSGSSDVLTFDTSGTLIRLRVTPQTGTHWWWTKFEVTILVPV